MNLKSKILKNKKKVIIILIGVAVLFAAVALIVHQTTKITNESYLNCALGDVNGDGFINSVDSLLLIESTEHEGMLFDSQKKLADVNIDGKVDSEDALILLRYTIGDIKKLPYVEDDLANKKGHGKAAEYENEFSFTTVQLLNEWDNGDGTHSYQLNMTIKNTGGDEIKNQESIVTFNTSVKLSKAWDCECEAGTDSITVKSENVPVKSALTCGFIVTAEKGLLINGVAVNDN